MANAASTFDWHARNRYTETRMALDQLRDAFNLNEELLAESGLFVFVPRNNRPQFIASCVLDTDRFAHLRRISALIWRRTSSQSVVPVVPASSAEHRRSISAAQAASTSAASPSATTSRLSINRAAISARSCSERASASCKTRLPMTVIKRTIASEAKLTKRLQATDCTRLFGGIGRPRFPSGPRGLSRDRFGALPEGTNKDKISRARKGHYG